MNSEASIPSQSSRKLFRAALVVFVLLVVAVIAGFLPRLRHRTGWAAETRELAVPTVAVVAPAPAKPMAGLLLPAEIKPWIEAPIYARASGYLKRWLVDLGERVEAGQLLAEIETPELDQELERARHQLAESEAALALAKTTAERYTELLKTASVSEQETAEKQADFALKTATVKAAQANVRRLEELKGFARITAPFAGVVTARNVDVGDLVTASGGKELFRLAQTDKLRVYVRVHQAEALKIAPGQSAELVIPEKPNRVFTGTVARTAGAISADSRTLLTELEVDNSRGEILAGCFGEVKFVGAKGAPPLTLPGNALLFRAEGPQVGVVLPDGKVELHSVKLGRDFGATVEVIGGVSTNDRVILNPPDSLADGATVRIAAAAKPEAAPTGKGK
jgi:RND family efflux transporter MFP subunit